MNNIKEASESEHALVGSLIKDTTALADIRISMSDFMYRHAGLVFDCITSLVRRGQPVTDTTVNSYAKQNYNQDLSAYLMEVNRYADVPKLCEWHSQQIRKSSLNRQCEVIGRELAKAAGSGDADPQDAIKQLMALHNVETRHEHTYSEVLDAAMEEIETAINNHGLVGISTGIGEMDRLLGGFHESDLIVLAARPAMGKTALMLNMVGRCYIPCGVISAEQGYKQIGQRMIAISGSVPVSRMRNGSLIDMEIERMKSTVEKIKPSPIFVYDKPAPTISEIMAQARKWKHHSNIKALYVDYLQRLQPDGKARDRHLQIAESVSAMKELARELSIPIVCLSQLNRDCEKREDKRPMMSDIAESGKIEQEADIIMTLYRDEVYDKHTQEPGIAELRVEKNRHGKTGFIKLNWRGEYMQFDGVNDAR